MSGNPIEDLEDIIRKQISDQTLDTVLAVITQKEDHKIFHQILKALKKRNYKIRDLSITTIEAVSPSAYDGNEISILPELEGKTKKKKGILGRFFAKK